ncbi:NADH dehydrogenase [ubiquinone] 1 alpha subcomplex subunit 3 isoform X1 [Myotis daubentonii]|nr:NADH dehydrogenase [ubiquinone] 1 alpha subcomplex subunit 3 isoform X1 [Myotis daubentonii]
MSRLREKRGRRQVCKTGLPVNEERRFLSGRRRRRRLLFCASAHARNPGLLGYRDHNSQSAPRPRRCLGPPFCASAHAQTQTAAPREQGLQYPGCSALSPPPPPPPRPRWPGDSPPSSGMPGPRSRCWSRPASSGASVRESEPLLLPFVSPFTKYATMINKVTPYNYPVPVRDDGNMPDVPSHPQDPQGPSLEWLKKL